LIRTEGNSGLVFAAINPAGERILYSSRGGFKVSRIGYAYGISFK
jgi:sugar/nucleoside kinase (ribokinase family)